ncbi:MAG: hypothetical protein PUB34_07240 [Clostridia bacterium]|nr:hypothetical protein [Clostridia bacterium]
MDIKEKTFNKYKMFIRILFGLGTAAAVLFIYSVLTSYDKELHYFALNDIKPVIYVCVVIVITVCALLSGFLLPKETGFNDKTLKNRRTTLSAVTDALCAIGIALVVISRIKPFINLFGNVIVDFTGKRIRILYGILIFTGILAFAFFVYDCFGKNKAVRGAFGIGLLLFFVCYLLCIYYDTTIPINSPMRIMNQVSCISVIIWFMLEIRAILRFTKPILYVAMGVIAYTFSVSLSVSTLLAMGIKIIDFNINALVGSVMLLTMAVHCTVRVRSIIMSNSKSSTVKNHTEIKQ